MNYAILLAAGKSERFNKKNKLLEKICNIPVWKLSLDLLTSHKYIDKVIVVCSPEIKNKITDKEIIKVDGGESRFRSLISGLNPIKKNLNKDDIILVHNAANPLASKKEISKVMKATKKYGAAGVGAPLRDTIKTVNKKCRIQDTVSRKNLVAMQTPQAVKAEYLLKGLSIIKNPPTDDIGIAEIAGIKPLFIKKSEHNIKITSEDDLILAKHFMNDLVQGFSCGIGEDSHKFASKEKGLRLGGINLNDLPKLEANSDGDLIIHALINAISSAMGGGSISFIADEMCQKGITDSKEYLNILMAKVKEKKFRINNISISLEAAFPKMEPFISEIKQSLSKLTDCEVKQIGITATTGEKLSSFGRGEGIKCTVMVSLVGGN